MYEEFDGGVTLRDFLSLSMDAMLCLRSSPMAVCLSPDL